MKKNPSISVVIPAYNEEAGIARVVKEFKKPYVKEVIVVDNNCVDNTVKIAKKHGARVVKQPKQGYGNAIRKGLKEAKGDLIFVTESDCTFYGDDMKKLMKHIDEHDLVLGTRTYRPYIEKGAKMDPFLWLGNIFIGKLLQSVILVTKGRNIPLTDVGCTFRVIKRPALQKIQSKFTIGGSQFSPEFMKIAMKNGLKVKETPVRYRARLGDSKITSDFMKSFKLGLEMIWLVLFK